jgi:hypothetical protein
MTIDPEMLTIFVIVLTLTVLMWAHPRSRSVLIGDAAGRERAARAAVAPRRPLVRLGKPSAQVADTLEGSKGAFRGARGGAVARAGAVVAEAHVDPDAGKLRPASVHMMRLTEIVSSAVERVHSVECLQRTAHEQVDSAHYALQNLLNELSAVMPISAPTQKRREVRLLQSQPNVRPVYETALAA